MNNLHVKSGDTIIVLSGKDKGKKGKILSADPAKGMVIVEGINVVTRHRKPRNQTDVGGIVKMESALRACKVMRVCPKCDKPTRVAHSILADGTKVRVCKHCQETL
jgi:large subunit ribosomal protein L24